MNQPWHTCVPQTHRPMSFESANTNLQLIENAESCVQLFSYSDGSLAELNFAGSEGLIGGIALARLTPGAKQYIRLEAYPESLWRHLRTQLAVGMVSYGGSEGIKISVQSPTAGARSFELSTWAIGSTSKLSTLCSFRAF